jgi:hypothetical protein
MRPFGPVAALVLIAALAATVSIASLEDLTLSPSRPALSVPVAALDRSTENRFVLVDVAEISNPDGFSLSFKVYFQPTEDTRIYLGSFAPFPADTPGRFIVSTRGLVHDDGQILVHMDLSDDEVIPQILEVRIRTVKFSDHHPGAAQSQDIEK